MSDFFLRRKWTLRAHGRQVVFVKRPIEKAEHVLMKALIWALYLPLYPNAAVETPIGDRYKPDVVDLDAQQVPRFWGEAGAVSTDKIDSLTRRFRQTHFVIGRWDDRLDHLQRIVSGAAQHNRHASAFDLIRFPIDSAERFIDRDDNIAIQFDDVEWLRVGKLPA